MKETNIESLNDNQKEAVTTTEGYIRVIAGAGSGKTKALSYRFAYLVNELGISPSNILCVTFTNKAANEMKKRIRTLIGDQDVGYVSTFHGFCVTILREEIHVIHYPSNFMILDEEDVNCILKNIYEEININSRHMTFDDARKFIGRRKLEGRYLRDIANLDSMFLKEKATKADTIEEKIWWYYLFEQKKCYGLDFDDLINFVLYILGEEQAIQTKWQKRLQYIMVDEFQDVSKKQYALVQLLSGYHENLFIVGDPDQTIYTWRGAKVDYILNFDKAFSNVKTIILNQNYRSSPEILAVSNSLIQKNKMRMDKDLIPVKSTKVPVYYYHAKSTMEEAQWLAKQIAILKEQGHKLSDIAILYRSHYISRAIEEEFIREEIPYILYSGTEFYKRKEIKDILCYLRMVVNGDEISFLRVVNLPKRNIGEKRIKELKAYAEKNNCSLYEALKENVEDTLLKKTQAKDFIKVIEKYKAIYSELQVSEILTGILNESGYEEMLRLSGDQNRLDNLAELKQSIMSYENMVGEDYTLEDYLGRVALFTNLDQQEKKDTVKLMTIHTAKGLEFPIVFVCGLNEGIFPSSRTDTKEKLEEERRLAYVAFTRAEDKLVLSDAQGVSNSGMFRYPSRFIFNIEKKLLHYEVELDESLVDESMQFIAQDKEKYKENVLLEVGDVILHKAFGKGKIIEIDKENQVYIIKFEQLKTNRNISFSMKLEKADNL